MSATLSVPSREACLALDRTDALAPLRGQFVIPKGVLYLDGNSLGVLPHATAKRVQQAIEHDWGQGLIRSWNDAGWVDLPRQVGHKIARLVGADGDDLMACDSTSVNLFKVLAAALSIQAIDQPHRQVIVSERGNFPTDLYIAEGLCHLLGGGVDSRSYSLQLVDNHDELDAALALQPAVVMLTQVDYRTGAMHDMAAVTAKIHHAGALAVWDLAHSAGALPVELDRSGADFAIGCGYKYLNGGPGAPAFVWTAKRQQSRALQPLSGWFGHAEPFRFEPGYRAAEGIKRYLAGTPAVLGMIALDAGVDSVLAAEAYGGMAALRAKSLALAELFITLIQGSKSAEVLKLITPRAGAARGSQVSFKASPELGDGYPLMQALIARGVIGDFRAPDILRFGLTPLYLRYCDVFDAAAILNHLIETREWDQPQFHVRAAVT
jgi:kynureninase